MPGKPSALGASSSTSGGGLGIVYAGTMAESTLAGAHVLGATTLTVADATGFRTDMRFGLHAPLVSPAVGTVEYHDIVSVDEATNEVEIAAPGLSGRHASGIACFAAPMWGADDVLALPAPAGAAHYAELDARFLYDMPQLNGNNSFYSGRSHGAWFSPHASWYETLTNYSYWYAGGNTEEGQASYSLGVIHATSSLSNFWTVDYEPAGNRLILLPADPNTADSFAPRIQQLTLAGRA